MSQVDCMLSDARLTLERVTAHEAHLMMEAGALVVDIRPVAQRVEFGEVPGAVVIERNVLEWRLDPTSGHHVPGAEDPDRPVVVMCQEGYASSFAALSLLRLGRTGATDMIGGFMAWLEAGLPTRLPRGPAQSDAGQRLDA